MEEAQFSADPIRCFKVSEYIVQCIYQFIYCPAVGHQIGATEDSLNKKHKFMYTFKMFSSALLKVINIL